MRALLTWVRRKFAFTDLDRELNPPLLLPVRFRAYEERDFSRLMALYRLVSAGRFPEGDEKAFAAYLRQTPNGMIVAELNGKIIGCSGLAQLGKNIYTLCYGLVHPDYQKYRIGTTMTLLRVGRTAIGQPDSIVHLLIFALPASLSFYRRFGFTDCGKWTAADDKEYPYAALSYSVHEARHIDSILQWREIRIRGDFKLSVSKTMEASLGTDGLGRKTYKIDTIEQGEPVQAT
ncbi:MAG: acetyltransferase, N-acetylglutamate synthase [Verrucomicrobia bacterium]|jgi:N-acetylglutamate synthase-like GNAT family acetyltransferase|nr:acetyltransferase, N-acetylglutamate synthase [Verrucomicrobiota bacterium]